MDTEEKYMSHLQGVVKIPTVSSVNDENTDWSQFDRLHQYMQESWPLIFEKLSLTRIGRASLLFHWKSENPKKEPVLFMAHQDVVPAIHEEQWSHPPFGGEVDEGCLWGRGAEDCKSVLTAEMDAVEELLEEGFAPDFDIYLSFGHNEEVQCTPDKKGSVLTAAYLKEQGIHLACLFDEGGNVEEGREGEPPLALVGMAEKAPNEFVLYKDGAGGHASKPGWHCAWRCGKGNGCCRSASHALQTHSSGESPFESGGASAGRTAEIHGRSSEEELEETGQAGSK